MTPWRDQIDEIFEDEYYRTCCDQDICPCFEIFKKNVRSRVKVILVEHDIRNQRLLNDMYEDAIARYYEMNRWLE